MDPVQSEKPAQINQSLMHGIDILMQLAISNEPLGSREVARQLGMEPTHVNRMLGTLAHMGMARRTADRKYTAGNGIHVMAALTMRSSNLVRVAGPHLNALAKQTGAMVAMGVLWRTEVCYLYHGNSPRTLEPGITKGRLYPARISSIGLSLLALKDDVSVRSLYPEDKELPMELAKIRKLGYAIGHTGSLAVLIGDGVAALALYERPATGADDAKYLDALRRAADAIAADLCRG